jgi:hypothetical protein
VNSEERDEKVCVSREKHSRGEGVERR